MTRKPDEHRRHSVSLRRLSNVAQYSAVSELQVSTQLSTDAYGAFKRDSLVKCKQAIKYDALRSWTQQVGIYESTVQSRRNKMMQRSVAQQVRKLSGWSLETTLNQAGWPIAFAPEQNVVITLCT